MKILLSILIACTVTLTASCGTSPGDEVDGEGVPAPSPPIVVEAPEFGPLPPTPEPTRMTAPTTAATADVTQSPTPAVTPVATQEPTTTTPEPPGGLPPDPMKLVGFHLCKRNGWDFNQGDTAHLGGHCRILNSGLPTCAANDADASWQPSPCQREYDQIRYMWEFAWETFDGWLEEGLNVWLVPKQHSPDHWSHCVNEGDCPNTFNADYVLSEISPAEAADLFNISLDDLLAANGGSVNQWLDRPKSDELASTLVTCQAVFIPSHADFHRQHDGSVIPLSHTAWPVVQTSARGCRSRLGPRPGQLPGCGPALVLGQPHVEFILPVDFNDPDFILPVSSPSPEDLGCEPPSHFGNCEVVATEDGYRLRQLGQAEPLESIGLWSCQ